MFDDEKRREFSLRHDRINTLLAASGPLSKPIIKAPAPFQALIAIFKNKGQPTSTVEAPEVLAECEHSFREKAFVERSAEFQVITITANFGQADTPLMRVICRPDPQKPDLFLVSFDFSGLGYMSPLNESQAIGALREISRILAVIPKGLDYSRLREELEDRTTGLKLLASVGREPHPAVHPLMHISPNYFGSLDANL